MFLFIYINTVCPKEKETRIQVQNSWTRLTGFLCLLMWLEDSVLKPTHGQLLQ